MHATALECARIVKYAEYVIVCRPAHRETASDATPHSLLVSYAGAAHHCAAWRETYVFAEADMLRVEAVRAMVAWFILAADPSPRDFFPAVLAGEVRWHRLLPNRDILSVLCRLP
jgi:hypothetical protein